MFIFIVDLEVFISFDIRELSVVGVGLRNKFNVLSLKNLLLDYYFYYSIKGYKVLNV